MDEDRQWQLLFLGDGCYVVWPFALALTVVVALTLVRRHKTWTVAIACIPFIAISIGAASFLAWRNETTLAALASDARAYRLAAPLRVGGSQLPAGTSVTEASNGSYVVHAGSETRVVRGLALTGDFDLGPRGLEGDVTLARDLRIHGVPCSSTAATTFSHGRLVQCSLSGPYRYAGMTFEKGTQVDFGDDGDGAAFMVGPIPPSLRVFGRPLSQMQSVLVDATSIVVGNPIEERAETIGTTDCIWPMRYDRSTQIAHGAEPCRDEPVLSHAVKL